jgi:ATP-binding cassette subfamily C (CFTR/MRP) protein 1
VDAHVGKALFADAIVGALRARGRAVILVTHALHFLSQCDYIYTLDHGRIVEEGTYAKLIAADGEFARLDREFGGESTEMEEAAEEQQAIEEDVRTVVHPSLDAAKAKANNRKGAGTGKLEGRLIVSEKRTTGSVSWRSAFLTSFCLSLILTVALKFTGNTSRQGKESLQDHY